MNGFLVQKVLKRGKRIKGRFFDLYEYDTQPNKPSFTVVCSLKVSKNAVLRNLLKRRIRELLRLKIKEGFFAGMSLVAVVKNNFSNENFEDLKKN